ncbi:MAG: saccharopine dehydrogenase NADP-binding domain-containing protein [Deinococcus sp.]|nr:saccharopine dehydrogenase NADP-binding domain-containing protein [Deinococcus sp.]
MTIRTPLVVGMGRVGSLIALLLSDLGMQVAGVDMHRGPSIPDNVEFTHADVTDPHTLARLCQGRDAVIACLPYPLILGVAQVAHAAGLHYFDLTEDVATTQAIRTLAASAGAVMIPQNGLAPGFIGMLGAYLAQQFDPGTLRQLKLRVGALPQHPTGQLGYAVNWSPEGLLRSYTTLCDVLVRGQRHQVPALSDPEILRIGGVTYEAFTTSGGLGTMAETYEGSVETLDYKSLRYPGHLAAMHRLLEELRFQEAPGELVQRIRLALPPDEADWVLVHASAQGHKHGALQTQALVLEYRPIAIGQRPWTAIAWTTAASLVAVVALVRRGTLPQQGFVKQEDIPLRAWLKTTAGRLFAVHHPALRAV